MPVWDICSGQWCNSEIPIKQNKKGTKYEEFTENLGKSKRTCLTAGAGDRRDPGHCRSVYYCTPESIYNEPENAFVADFIGDSNIIGATMIRDRLVEILGARFDCVDTGFGENKPVDVVIRPEDVELVAPEEGIIHGTLTHSIFKGVHYEMEVMANGFEWLVQSTKMVPVGTKVGIKVDPFNIQIMKKPESEDEEAIGVNE